MIPKEGIDQASTTLGVHTSNVQRDYVFGWLLCGIYSHNPSQLAEKIGLTRGAVSKLIDRLVKKDFVLCRAGKTDRRYQTVSLSASGRKLVPVLAALADDNDREFFGHLDKEHQAEVTAALQKIVHRHGLKSVPMD